MGCLVESGGCERRATEPFVQHLNRIEKRQYSYKSCLDIIHRETPQPETLYVDEGTKECLVIERKSIAWPPNYAKGHALDHFVQSEISRELASIDLHDVYCLQLPWLIAGKKRELRIFAKDVASQIKKHYSSLKPGQVLESRVSGRHWAFYIQPEIERDEDSPSSGLFYSWLTRSFDLMCSEAPMELKESLNSIYNACVRKFSGYLGSRRILLLHPYGELDYKLTSWWEGIFAKHPPPLSINEIWKGSFDEEFLVWDFGVLCHS